MITIFSTPKAFRGHFGIIQRNAIQSWLHIPLDCEIILLCNDEGTAEVASEFNLRHIPSVACNEYGTPFVSALFATAKKEAEFPILCYVNADIIFMNDFIPAVLQAFKYRPDSLIVGRRWDLDVHEPVDFSKEWEAELKKPLTKQGRLYSDAGIDYFVFPKELFGEIPPFLIGRPGWDNWLLYHARSKKIPIIDITKMATVVHQNHDYSHHPKGERGVWKGEEAKYNWNLLGGYSHGYTLKDANYKLTQKGLKLNLSPYYFYRNLVTLSEYYPFFRPLVKLIRLGRENPNPFVR